VPEALGEIDRWLGMMRATLAQNYDRLDTLLETMNQAEEDREE
jgi:hypothetical protein